MFPLIKNWVTQRANSRSWWIGRPSNGSHLGTGRPLIHSTDICINEMIIIVSDNGLSPGWHQAIIWTNAGILVIGPLGINFSEILIKINIFSFKKMHVKLSSAKWRLFRLGLSELTQWWRLKCEKVFSHKHDHHKFNGIVLCQHFQDIYDAVQWMYCSKHITGIPNLATVMISCHDETFLTTATKWNVGVHFSSALSLNFSEFNKCIEWIKNSHLRMADPAAA